MQATGIPIVLPIDRHGIFSNAINSFAVRNSISGDNYYLNLELVRLSFPRKVYTQAHMNVISESVEEIFLNRKNIKALNMIYELKICAILSGEV